MRRILAILVVTNAQMRLLEWPVASAVRWQAELSLAGGAHMAVVIRPQPVAAPKTERDSPSSLCRALVAIFRLRWFWRFREHFHFWTEGAQKLSLHSDSSFFLLRETNCLAEHHVKWPR